MAGSDHLGAPHSIRHRSPLAWAAAACLLGLMTAAAVLSGCGTASVRPPSAVPPAATRSTPVTGPATTRPPTVTASTTTTTTPSPTVSLSATVEPDAGTAPVDTFLAGATKTLDLNMYELVDPDVETILVARATAGVDVRVILDRNRERAANQAAFATLTAGGVHVTWAPAHFDADHAKYVCADDDRCLIMTGNLVSEDDATTRDFVVSDRQPADVAAIEGTFGADAAGTAVAPRAGTGDLVWSPGSEGALLGVIADARHTLLVENEEMSSSAVRNALRAAVRRGVAVTVTMTCDHDDADELANLAGAGVTVRCYHGQSPLYIHAKAMVADGATVYVGSINFSSASMSYNRELGIVTTDPAVVGVVAATLSHDGAGGSPFGS